MTQQESKSKLTLLLLVFGVITLFAYRRSFLFSSDKRGNTMVSSVHNQEKEEKGKEAARKRITTKQVQSSTTTITIKKVAMAVSLAIVCQLAYGRWKKAKNIPKLLDVGGTGMYMATGDNIKIASNLGFVSINATSVAESDIVIKKLNSETSETDNWVHQDLGDSHKIYRVETEKVFKPEERRWKYNKPSQKEEIESIHIKYIAIRSNLSDDEDSKQEMIDDDERETKGGVCSEEENLIKLVVDVKVEGQGSIVYKNMTFGRKDIVTYVKQQDFSLVVYAILKTEHIKCEVLKTARIIDIIRGIRSINSNSVKQDFGLKSINMRETGLPKTFNVPMPLALQLRYPMRYGYEEYIPNRLLGGIIERGVVDETDYIFSIETQKIDNSSMESIAVTSRKLAEYNPGMFNEQMLM